MPRCVCVCVCEFGQMRICVREVTESRYHPAINRHRVRLPEVDATLIKLLHGVVSEIGISEETTKEGDRERQKGGRLSWLVVRRKPISVSHHPPAPKAIFHKQELSRSAHHLFFALIQLIYQCGVIHLDIMNVSELVLITY